MVLFLLSAPDNAKFKKLVSWSVAIIKEYYASWHMYLSLLAHILLYAWQTVELPLIVSPPGIQICITSNLSSTQITQSRFKMSQLLARPIFKCFNCNMTSNKQVAFSKVNVLITTLNMSWFIHFQPELMPMKSGMIGLVIGRPVTVRVVVGVNIKMLLIVTDPSN